MPPNKVILLDTGPQYDQWFSVLAGALHNLIIDGVQQYELVSYKDALQGSDAQYIILGEIDEAKIGGDIFQLHPNIHTILSLWAGVDRILKHPSFTKNMRLYRMIDDGLTQAMVEYAIGHTLFYHLNMPRALQARQQKTWDYFMPPLAKERRVGVMGLGVIGASIAAQLHHIGFTVLGYSRTQKQLQGITSYAGDDMAAFFGQCDMLIMVLPDTPQTHHIMHKKTLAMLPKGAIIMNIGRGAHVHTQDLIHMVEKGHISHALLDVFEQEPLPQNHALWQCNNIHLTPHNAGVTSLSAAKHITHMLQKIYHHQYTDISLVNIENGY